MTKCPKTVKVTLTVTLTVTRDVETVLIVTE